MSGLALAHRAMAHPVACRSSSGARPRLVPWLGMLIIVLAVCTGCGAEPAGLATSIPLAHLTLYAAGTDGALTAYVAASGKPRWHFTTGGASVSPPSESGGIVYLGSNDGNVYALRTSDGSLVWKSAIGTATSDMVVSTPAVLGGVVVVSTVAGNLYAFDATSGTPRWHSGSPSTPGADFCIPGRPQLGISVVYYGTSCGIVFALRPGDGQIFWQRTVGPAATFPLLVDDTLYVGIAMGTTAPGGGMTALSALDGSSLWTYHDARGGMSQPALVGDTLYATDDAASLYALDANTGHARWSTSLGYTGISPVAADANGAYAAVSGFLSALDPTSGHQRWSTPLPGEEHGGPLVYDGLLFTSAGDRYGQTLAAYDARNGKQVWHVALPGNTALALATGGAG